MGNLHSKFGNAIGLLVLELFAMYATDGQTDRQTNAYFPLAYGRGHKIMALKFVNIHDYFRFWLRLYSLWYVRPCQND